MNIQQGQRYILESGDSLGSLAHEVYGSVSNFRELADQNGLDIFDQLPIGKEINIPTLKEVDAAISAATARATSTLNEVADVLDLSKLKQPGTSSQLPHQLISWIL